MLMVMTRKERRVAKIRETTPLVKSPMILQNSEKQLVFKRHALLKFKCKINILKSKLKRQSHEIFKLEFFGSNSF